MKQYLDYLFISIISLFSILVCFNKITYNWDFIGYMGVVNSYLEKDSKKIHQKTYFILDKSIDVKKYELKSEGYRKVMSIDHKAFEENLSFYKIRPLYTMAIYVLYRLGFNLLFSIKILTILPIVFILGMLYFSVKREMNNRQVAFLFSMFFVFSPLIIKIATTTPDALSGMFLLMLSLAYYEQRNKFLQIIIMFLLVATRTDNFLWIVLLLLFDVFNKFSFKKMKINLFILICIFIFYQTINFCAGNSGLWIVYYNTLVNRLNFPLSQTPKFNLQDYYYGQIFALKYTIFTLFVTFIIAILGYINFKKNQNKSIYVFNIVATTILSLFLRLVLFPAYNSRYMLILFFIPIYFLVIDNKINIYNKIRYLPLFLKIKPILSSKKTPKN